MDEITLVSKLIESGQLVVFVWLFLRERKRNSELQDQRVNDFKDWQLLLLSLLEQYPRKKE